MPHAPGKRIGAYEIQTLLGRGGMGEVYRARDIRLDRIVALKLMTDDFEVSPERLMRFEQEARATAALSHPSIVAVYDVGTWGGQPYLVSEFLDGETLRVALNAGPLPVRKAINYAGQIARGLAAAHRRGIVHRDLKPENVIITRDGLVKILDFGLAKLTEMARHLQVASETTAPGMVLGTLGYLSPEQAKGETPDERADIFSFGAVFYEMISGRRAFQGGSPAETLSAILSQAPPDLVQIVPGLPPGLARIVERCLEKNKEDRFQNAADLGFALDAFATSSADSMVRPRRRPIRWRRIAAAVLLPLAIAGAFALGARWRRVDPPQFRQLTFRRGTVQAARFAGDGQTIVYAAGWEGHPSDLFSTRPEAAEARPLQMRGTGLFALSSKGDMAVAIDPVGFGRVEATLGRAALAGGPARKLADRVLAADWSPDGSTLAIVQSHNGRDILEYPPGKTLYDPKPGNITHIRFSPSGDAIAILAHPVAGDTAGSVMLVDLQGNARTLSSGWNSVLGLAWAPDGKEIWFTGTRSGAAQALYAVTRSGAERLLLRAPATLTLHDVAPDGRALITRDAWGAGVMALPPGASAEHDVSWLDGSTVWDISADGTTMILEESWEGGGAKRSIYLRTTDGAPAVRLGDGVPLALSPDKQWVLSTTVAGDQIVVLPTGVGQAKTLPRGKVTGYFPAARWIPGTPGAFLVSGSEAGHQGRIYRQSIDGGDPEPVTPEGAFGRMVVLPDGQAFVTRNIERRLTLFPLGGGEPRLIAGAEGRDLPIVVSDDGQWLYVQGAGELPANVFRVNLRTGRREAVRSLAPPDPAGVMSILRIVMTPDGRSYAYTFVRALSSLYLVDSIR
jgi:eukaryotic-like serine/threonine-protein kinase